MSSVNIKFGECIKEFELIDFMHIQNKCNQKKIQTSLIDFAAIGSTDTVASNSADDACVEVLTIYV